MPADTDIQPPGAPSPEEEDAAWERSLQALLERVATESRGTPAGAPTAAAAAAGAAVGASAPAHAEAPATARPPGPAMAHAAACAADPCATTRSAATPSATRSAARSANPSAAPSGAAPAARTPAPSAREHFAPAVDPSASPPPPGPQPEPEPAEPVRRRTLTTVAGTAAALALGALLAWPWRSHPPGETVTAGVAAPAAPREMVRPTPTPAPQPAATRASQARPATLPASARTAGEPGAELAGQLAPLALRDLRGATDAAALRAAGQGPPTLLLARYDTLAALPDDAVRPALRLVAPLFIEPVRLWVRGDTTLQHPHELAGRRLAVTADDSATARSATDALVGLNKRRPAFDLVPDEAAALAALQAGRVDAWLQVGLVPLPTPSAKLRPMLLDGGDPGSAPALRTFLPLPTAAGAAPGGGAELGVMVFLAVAGRDDAAIEPLAAAGLQALCRSLPDLAARGHPAWATVRPTRTLPAGHPYARVSSWPPSACGARPAETSLPTTSLLAEGALR